MALVRRLHSSLKGFLCNRVLVAQSRHIGSTTPRFDDENDADEGSGEEQIDEPSPDSTLSPLGAEEDPKPKPPPYAEELRKILTAKYLSNQPIARPHSLCDKSSTELNLQQLRSQYKQRLSAVRKQYMAELDRARAAKATQDKKQREETRLAKEERLRLKKEKSARRAIEVAEEKRILQEQLAAERAERRAYRKMVDMGIEERRQMERDIIRQESGNWIEEKDLEARIVDAYVNPIEL